MAGRMLQSLRKSYFQALDVTNLATGVLAHVVWRLSRQGQGKTGAQASALDGLLQTLSMLSNTGSEQRAPAVAIWDIHYILMCRCAVRLALQHALAKVVSRIVCHVRHGDKLIGIATRAYKPINKRSGIRSVPFCSILPEW